MSQKKIPDNQITVYQRPDGKVNIEVLYADENIWLPQKRIAELFDVDRSVVTKHLKNIFSSSELEESLVCANFAHTAEDGKTYQTKYYSLWEEGMPIRNPKLFGSIAPSPRPSPTSGEGEKECALP
jgi:hypothetical protein